MASAAPEIRAIYWDICGVLLTNGWDHQERARVLQQFSIPRDEYEARHADANDRWERGELTDDEFLKQTVFFKERSFTPAQFHQALREQCRAFATRHSWGRRADALAAAIGFTPAAAEPRPGRHVQQSG